VRIAIAGSIRDVCQAKPASGVDLVALLSTILSKDTNAIPVALSVESLTLLCKCVATLHLPPPPYFKNT